MAGDRRDAKDFDRAVRAREAPSAAARRDAGRRRLDRRGAAGRRRRRSRLRRRATGCSSARVPPRPARGRPASPLQSRSRAHEPDPRARLADPDLEPRRDAPAEPAGSGALELPRRRMGARPARARSDSGRCASAAGRSSATFRPAAALEFIAPSPGGLLQILEGDEVLFEIGVNFLDEIRRAICAGRATADVGELDGRGRRSARRERSRRPIRCSGCCWRSRGTAMLGELVPAVAAPSAPAERRRSRACLVSCPLPRAAAPDRPAAVPATSGAAGPPASAASSASSSSSWSRSSRPCRWRRIGGKGVDVVVVADLSRSMPADSRSARARDRPAPRAAARDRRPRRHRDVRPRGAHRTAPRGVRRGRRRSCRRWIADGSDLGGAIALAASLIPRGRPGRLIVLSDGEANGTPVAAAAHEAAARGVPIDFRAFSRGRGSGRRRRIAGRARRGGRARAVPVHRVGARRSNRRERGGAAARRRRDRAERGGRFQPGATQLTFRDVDRSAGSRALPARAGRPAATACRRTTSATARVRVEAPATILLVNGQRRAGQPEPRARGRQAARARSCRRQGAARSRRAAAYRAVILENVPAGQLGPQALDALGALRRPISAAACSSPAAARRSASAATSSRRSIRTCRCRWRSRTSIASCRWRWPWRSTGPAAWRCPPATAARRWIWRTSARAPRSTRSGRSTRSASSPSTARRTSSAR